jgi:hypothetical protein
MHGRFGATFQYRDIKILWNLRGDFPTLRHDTTSRLRKRSPVIIRRIRSWLGQTSRKTESSRWLSTARFRTPQCGFDLTAYPAQEFEGFGDPKNAEQATAIFAKEQIDKL